MPNITSRYGRLLDVIGSFIYTRGIYIFFSYNGM
jgi:hypothetical protein